MKEFILLMHNNAVQPRGDWERYLESLRSRDIFDGGSSIGPGEAFRKAGDVKSSCAIIGYIRIRAESLEAAKEWLRGNPVYEGGGTVEIREPTKG